jgi:hypothetical protein
VIRALPRAFALLLGLGSVACGPPAPNRIVVRSNQAALGARIELAEGDLLVVDASPIEGEDDTMELCVNGSANGGSVRLGRVRDQCRRFIVVGQSAGTSTLAFEVRGTTTTIEVGVTPWR